MKNKKASEVFENCPALPNQQNEEWWKKRFFVQPDKIEDLALDSSELLQAEDDGDYLVTVRKDEADAFIRQEIRQAKIEGNLRREKEILIMMVDCEKEGWTIKRFIDSFAQIVDKNGRESNLKKQ
jgi:Mg2+ and Co2+ transporter CorA